MAHGHVVEDERDVPARLGVGEAHLRQPAPVVAVEAAFERALPGPQRRRDPSQVRQNTVDVEQARGLHDPRDHQVPEGLVVQNVEPDRVVHPADRVIQQPRRGLEHLRRWNQPLLLTLARRAEQGALAGRLDQPGLRHNRRQTEVELTLTVIGDKPPRLRDEQPQLGLVVRGTHMTHDPTLPTDRLHDLDRRRPRSGTHAPDPDHQPTLLSALSAN